MRQLLFYVSIFFFLSCNTTINEEKDKSEIVAALNKSAEDWSTGSIDAYMDVAIRFSQLSTAEKLKVGAILVKDDRIISIGYNGTPKGWCNVCEDSNFKTKPEVIHAEMNCISKA